MADRNTQAFSPEKNPEGFRLLHTLRGHKDLINRIAWSPNGKLLASTSNDRTVRIWNLGSGKEVTTIPHRWKVYDVTWSPGGEFLASAGAGGEIFLWNSRGGVKGGRISTRVNAVYTLAWVGRLDKVVAGLSDGTVRVYDRESGRELITCQGHDGDVNSIIWVPPTSSIVSASGDGRIIAWDVNSGEEKGRIRVGMNIQCLALKPNSLLLGAPCDRNGGIGIWNIDTQKRVKTLKDHDKEVRALSFSTDGRLLASKSDDGTVRLWDTLTWNTVSILQEIGSPSGRPGLAFHPNEPILASLGEDDTAIRIWEIDTDKLLHETEPASVEGEGSGPGDKETLGPPPPTRESILAASVADQPSSEDYLGFKPYVKAIAKFLTNAKTKAPLTISIEGEWGSGKSSFMLQLKEQLRGKSELGRLKELANFKWYSWESLWASFIGKFHTPKELTVDFNAWRHDKEESLWAAFALQFINEISTQRFFLCRWWGHALLFFRRLFSREDWLNAVCFLATRLVMILVPIIVVVLIILKGYPWVDSFTKVTTGAAPDSEAKNWLEVLAGVLVKMGLPAASIVAIIPLVTKLKKMVGGSIDLDVRKYLRSPNYEDRVSFIEKFHKDFKKIVQAYAGNRKVFVFVDDVDRCEIPKAADLMQALNLMISDDPQLVFIIGMDREKVSAGLAVKHEKLLSYLPPFSKNEEDNVRKALNYGYLFIEKFIQIPFLVPKPAEDEVRRYLREMSPHGEGQSSSTPGAFSSPKPGDTGEPGRPNSPDENVRAHTGAENGQPMTTSESVTTADSSKTQNERRERVRLAFEEDSTEIHNIALMVTPTLGYNPRRIKQFLNLFRLRAFIANETGLFDEIEGIPSKESLTLPQLGKFVAISLRFPLLLSHLEADRELLVKLQKIAFGDTPSEAEMIGHVRYWESQEELLHLLRKGCYDEVGELSPEKAIVYGFVNLKIDKLLVVSPAVERPTELEQSAKLPPLDTHLAEGKKKKSERSILEENLDKSIEELELSVRSFNCLEAAGIETVRDLVQKTENEMLKYRDFGRQSLSEIKATLKIMHLSFHMEIGEDGLPMKYDYPEKWDQTEMNSSEG